MGDADAKLLGRNSAGECGVYVSHDDDPVGKVGKAELFKGDHDARSLFGV